MSHVPLSAALELATRIYARHSAGCCLHIAIDDGNMRDRSLRFCAETAIARKHEDCAYLAKMLLEMSRTQRYKLVSLLGSRLYGAG